MGVPLYCQKQGYYPLKAYLCIWTAVWLSQLSKGRLFGWRLVYGHLLHSRWRPLGFRSSPLSFSLVGLVSTSSLGFARSSSICCELGPLQLNSYSMIYRCYTFSFGDKASSSSQKRGYSRLIFKDLLGSESGTSLTQYQPFWHRQTQDSHHLVDWVASSLYGLLHSAFESAGDWW